MTQRAAPLDGQVRNWLLALLRYAVTGEDADRLAVLTMGKSIDTLGSIRQPRSSFAFFRKTSVELCNALCDDSAAHKSETLNLHLARIDDPRLRRAFSAAVELEPTPQVGRGGKRRKRRDPRDALWKGLGV